MHKSWKLHPGSRDLPGHGSPAPARAGLGSWPLVRSPPGVVYAAGRDGMPPGGRPDPDGELRARRLDALLRFGHDAVLLHDERGQILDANDRAAAAYGLSVQELCRRDLPDLRAPEALPHLQYQLSRVVEEEALVYQTVHRRRDGSTFPVEVRARLLEVRGRRYVQSIIRDLSDRQPHMDRLLRAERLASLGTLAAGVAHEISNPLSVVSANLEFLIEKLPELVDRAAGQPALEALRDALAGAGRASEILAGMRSLGRAAELPRVAVSLKGEIETAVLLVRGDLRARARLELDLPEPTRPVLARPRELSQVFVNLLLNAAQAIPAGSPDEHRILVTLREGPDRVTVQVDDTGSGIDAEVLPRIFEPFYSTKPVGSGTGLGLAICQGIIRDLGGRIEAFSEPGRGASLRVTLPTLTADQAAAAPARMALVPRTRVLVVNHDPVERRTVRQALSADCDVAGAGSPEEAVTLVEQEGEFDLVLVDLPLQGMSGPEFLRVLGQRAPAQARRVAFTSSAPPPEELVLALPGALDLLARPVDPARVRAVALRHAVGRRSGPAARRPAPDGSRP